jgi:hypothetical protein
MMNGTRSPSGLSRLLPSFVRRRLGRWVAPTPAAPADPAEAAGRLDPGASITLTITANPAPEVSPAAIGSTTPQTSPANGSTATRRMFAIGGALVLAVVVTSWGIYWITDSEERITGVNDTGYITVLGLALLLGFLVAMFSRFVGRIESDVVLLFLTVAPLFLLLVATERINGLKAPGGIELSFVERVVQIRNDPANQAVVLEVAEAAPISPGLPPESVGRLTMSIQFGRGDYQRKWLIENLSPGQSQYVNLRYVVFVDADNRFIAFMPLSSFINIIQLEDEGTRLERVINQGRRPELLRFPGVSQNALVATGPATDDLPTNGDVLRTMLHHNLPAVAVVSPDGRLIGLVERDQLVSDLLLDLTSTDEDE